MSSPGMSGKPELVRQWEDELVRSQTWSNMVIRSPAVSVAVMLAAGVLGIVVFVWLVTKFVATGEAGALVVAIFALVMFSALSWWGTRSGLKRLRAKRAYDEYYRQRPGA